jgi:hypothetical protein
MKKPLRSVHGTVAIGLVLGLLVPGIGRTAPVPDLTGTWEGKYVCKVLIDGVPTRFKVESVLKITHTDTALNADIDNTFLYVGFAAARTSDPVKGAATFVECATTPTSNGYNDVFSVTVNTKPAHATLKGKGAYSNGPAGHIGGICTFNYKRIDLADPGIGPCP